jgi:hypothetical protein
VNANPSTPTRSTTSSRRASPDGGADPAGVAGAGAELLDVEGDQVAVLDPVTASGQPGRVPAGAAADVGHHRRWRREVAEQDLPGALELHHPDRRVQAVPLATQRVVVVQGGGVIRLAHG